MARAAIYTRISLDRESEERGVTRQREDCEALAERLDHDVVEVFTDNDTGASTRSRKGSRPAYASMLEKARNGAFDVILAYSNSRLTRRPMEFEDLIALHERHGVRIATCVSGADDLSTADGRMTARIKASVDAAEVERTAERVARAHLEAARSGRPVGGYRPFGWEDDRATLNPEEAALVRDALERIAEGVPMASICDEWNASGVTTRAGKPWTHKTLKQYALNPRLVGWRTYKREVLRDADGEPVQGLWEPMVDLDLWERVRARLEGRKDTRVRIPRKGMRRYLLSGLLTCGKCMGPMYAAPRTYQDKDGRGSRVHYYRCDRRGCGNGISGRGLDEMIARLAVEAMARAEPSEEEVTEAPPYPREAEIAEARRKARELMDAFNDGRLPGEMVFPFVKQHTDHAEALEAEKKAWQAEHLPVPEMVQGITRERWDATDLDIRQAALEALLPNGLVVKASTRKGNRFDPSRVVIAR